jgi:hypothetical protein
MYACYHAVLAMDPQGSQASQALQHWDTPKPIGTILIFLNISFHSNLLYTDLTADFSIAACRLSCIYYLISCVYETLEDPVFVRVIQYISSFKNMPPICAF